MGRIAFLFFVVLLGLGHSARADTSMEVRFGFGGQFRPGDWTPVYVTLTDPSPRNVMLEIRTPTDSGVAMRIHQAVAVGPEPATYMLLAPLTYDLANVIVTAVDRNTRRKRAETFLAEPDDVGNPVIRVQAEQPFIGVSGRGGAMDMIRGENYNEQRIVVGYLEPTLLPATAEGYTSLDVLALNQPNLDPSGASPRSLRFEQQQAIVDWVKAGGNLILWPGDDAIPAAGPIINALPCHIGDIGALGASPDTLSASGLPARFSQMKNRALTPANGAETFNLLGDSGAIACHRRLGFGTIVVLSLDASSLQFSDTSDANRFWEPILNRVIEPIEPQSTTQPYYYNNTKEMRTSQAVQQTMDLLGDIPGVGSFGFSYVAIVLVGLMFVVGPLDWFVLKKLGRQPWTWITTAGWIALVSGGAIYIGHVFKSGDLHFRSLRLIDQAGGETVATIDFVGIYSPRTTEYEVEVDPQNWFRLPQMNQYYYGGPLLGEIGFRQDYRGNRPEEMYINVWNLRFLQGQSIKTGPQVIEAKLQLTNTGRITGSITNRGPQRIDNIAIQISNRVGQLNTACEPNQTIEVDATLEDLRIMANENWYPGYQLPYAVNFKHLNYLNLFPVAMRRHERTTRLMELPEPFACIYAETIDAPPPAKLGTEGAIEQHYQIIRAIVPLGNPEPTP